MSGRLRGKRVFATASAQGIGRATVEAFLAAGAEVIASDINMPVLNELAEHPNVSLMELDCTDGAAIAAAAAEVGTVDVLFNCAGFVHHGTILDSTEDEFDAAITLNVKAMYRTIRAFLPAMLANGGGSIINMASVASSVKGVVLRSVYGISKAAVIGLTKSVAADYVAQGIRCNCLAPGTVDTPSLRQRIAAFDDPEAARRMFIARQPTGQLASAEQIAPLAVFLAADESRFVTGQVCSVDGGMTI